MSDIDRVFSRLGPKKHASSDKRELVNIPRRGGSPGSRVVEVVHVRSGGAQPGKEAPRRSAFSLRSETWDDGFPARPAARLPAGIAPAAPGAAEPVTHVMPMWEPASPAAEGTRLAPSQAPHAPEEARAIPSCGRPGRGSSRRVADPFDADDDGANCIRCGYLVERPREQRGLMTCAACG